MSSKIEVVAYANGDELSNLLDDRTVVVAGVADGWRSTGLVRHDEHKLEVVRLVEWGRANQQLAQSAMDKLEEALADCDRLKMHLADHRETLDALLAAPAVERQDPIGYVSASTLQSVAERVARMGQAEFFVTTRSFGEATVAVYTLPQVKEMNR